MRQGESEAMKNQKKKNPIFEICRKTIVSQICMSNAGQIEMLDMSDDRTWFYDFYVNYGTCI